MPFSSLPGLSVAVRLNAKGYEVTLFDSKPMPGGLLRYGIPNFKLDKAVIDRRMTATFFPLRSGWRGVM